MTIEEARMKECRQIPAFMQSTSNANLIDAGSVQFIPSRCTADECMAWRWKIEPKQIDVGRTTFGEPVFDTQYLLSTTDGYCGLAGKEGAE